MIRVNLEITGLNSPVVVDDEGNGSLCWGDIMMMVVSGQARTETFDESGKPVFDSVLSSCGDQDESDIPICHVKDGYSIKITFPFIELEVGLEDIQLEES